MGIADTRLVVFVLENEGISITVKRKEEKFNMAEQEKTQGDFFMGLLIGFTLDNLNFSK